MIPPCDPAILENNPQFKRVYQNLTTNLLKPDASTRANDAQPARKAVLEELKICRTRHAKKQIKKQTLRELAFDPGNNLPDDFRDTIMIISFYLDSSPSQLDLDDDDLDGADTLSLLAPDIDKFYSGLPTLTIPFSNAISSSLDNLRLIAHAGDVSDPPSTEPPRTRLRARRAPVTLSSRLEDRLRQLRQKQLSELPATRTRMATTAAEVLATRAAVLERTVTLLERAKHGALARATKAKAEHLAIVAQSVEGKLNMTKLDISATINTPETINALSRYRRHLRDTRERLEERQTSTLEKLKAYEGIDPGATERDGRRSQSESGPMKEITRQYGDLIQEIEDVRLEIEKL
ncbi:hypothetical protein ETB97_004726 [Aspergillus alliaceus]|uniref:Uncharacterized protein n=1 Tax=Petromyces alliaceus TaxID=209559 RepID=A0A5N6GAD2_PETAA|nr:uncharacterized protein BDW43DRAFT_295872 [Aspergillus alliaceus]KAB8239412.1 hypothetical protein BDW43DRAFT_295872 [Aspergillus alliaceus]KAE8392045.1 hypothetical protein BDV23DRAFT_192758 [Aspergillus alliaceus]KAF5858173.1 hypothetical protein ETB97_004726 [Aspergillus burnettii]